MQVIKELSGHSGCKVFLCVENKYFIRKISSSIEYNRRLLNQLNKHKKCLLDGMRCPSIIGEGYENGLFFYDMEYIDGVSLSESFRTIQISSIYKLIDEFISPRNGGSFSNETNNIIVSKINDIKRRILIHNNSINESINLILQIDWSKLPISPCHGDLTLENIINKNNEFYYIDYLDSFIDSWIVDAAKLMQDFMCFWSYRDSDINANLLVRLTVAKDYLINRISLIDNLYLMYLYGMLLIHLLRILQYPSSDYVSSRVIGNIEAVTKIIVKEMHKHE